LSDHFDSRAERLAVALDDFIRSSPDVEAAAVVSFDGLPMASALPDDLEEDRVGAMSAALLSLGEQAALGLGRGQLNQVFVEGEHGFVFLMSARDQAVLAAIASRSAKIGFMLFEMRRAADRIGEALESPVLPVGRGHEAEGGHDGEPSGPADLPASAHHETTSPAWEPAREPNDQDRALAAVGVTQEHVPSPEGPGHYHENGSDHPSASSDAWHV
jgi:uncharacterized protein